MTEHSPGSLASTEQLLLLARAYHRAAETLLGNRRKGDPISLAPFRLAAIHAMELYLNALLRNEGLDHKKVRGLQHDLASRTKLAQEAGLVLRKRTAEHLQDLAKNREYLVSRYDPDLTLATRHVNRLVATLNELHLKANERITKSKPAPAANPKVA